MSKEKLKVKLGELTDFGGRLTWVLDDLQSRLGLNQKEIAEKIGVHSASLSQLKSGASRKASMATLLLLREVYSVNPAWLQEGKGQVYLDSSEQNKNSSAEFAQIKEFDPKTMALVAFETTPNLSFHKDWLHNQLQLEQDQVAHAKVVGNAMDPTLKDGESILLDLTRDFVQNEKIYFIEVSGSVMVRRLRQKLDGTLLVLCDNPDFETEQIAAKEAKKLKIIGQVRWHGGEL